MRDATDRIPVDPECHTWDIVVIGTGAGGATAGFNLARLGRSVLFLERGKLLGRDPTVVKGAPLRSRADAAVDFGWWPDRVYQRTDDGDVPRPIPVGCGTGGSTALFAMVMDRLRPVDLTPGRFVHRASTSSVPETWPIEYDELAPHYREAEALFRVRGTDDPLTPACGALLDPPAPSETETAIHETLADAGLHPYRLHYAREGVEGCTGCFGRLCPHECRNDAGRICVTPALERHGARILPNCRVVRLDARGRAIRQAICLWNGRRVAIRARVFLMALNAFQTPALLLRSASDAFPDGLGNSSGMVGRNLMLHVSDSLVVRFDAYRERPNGLLNPSFNHGISLNDFYVRDGAKLGNVHAHAACVPAPPSGSRGSAVFHTIVEDFPYLVNRVTPASGSDEEVVWEYRYPDELRVRSRMLIDRVAAALRGVCAVDAPQPAGALNIAHGCGTCRFGADPRTSVLDRDNRLHDVDNAYVVDASFFPSSGGMHPSLTIVANSLRVSALIARR